MHNYCDTLLSSSKPGSKGGTGCVLSHGGKEWEVLDTEEGFNSGLGVKLALGFRSEVSSAGLGFSHFLHLGEDFLYPRPLFYLLPRGNY